MRRTLDTNICSYILRRHPAGMIEQFSRLNRDALWLSVIVVAELRYGARRLGSPRFSAIIEAWVAEFTVLDWSATAAWHYAEVRAHLEQAGTPIGNMDLMIAAHALAEDSVVITNNAREFQRVPALALDIW
jgi:tRNA(fMet)-specific endonuclease VapC